MSKTYSVTIPNSKKKRKSKRKGSRSITFGFFLIIIILTIGGYYLYNYAKSCEGDNCISILKPISATIEPKLKQDNGKTNILIVGIDTRGGNSGLMNTDTIIFVTINHENKTVIMSSIPRDLWLRYKLPNGNTTGSKVNSVYASGEWQRKGAGIDTLISVTENIFGEPVHYYVKVTLEGFIDIIDAIGGVDIDIPEYYKDAYPASELPKELQATCIPFYHDGKYCLFEFKKGVEHMDGQRALIYARSRLLSPRGDFDRAARQQRVISSVKDKVLSSETYLNPQKVWEIYNIVKKNIETSSFTINDIRAFLNLRNEINTDEIGHIVLDPYFGNVLGKYIYVGDWASGRGYHILPRDESFKAIQKVLEAISLYPKMYEENPVISIYNATGKSKLEKDWSKLLEVDNPLITVKQQNKVIQNPNDQYKGISIYRFAKEEKPATEEFLKEYFDVSEIKTEASDGTKAFSGEDYIIVIGKDSQ
jgi:LCP family protein required for cell wall assembly